jgi:hypothetical protein
MTIRLRLDRLERLARTSPFRNLAFSKVTRREEPPDPQRIAAARQAFCEARVAGNLAFVNHSDSAIDEMAALFGTGSVDPGALVAFCTDVVNMRQRMAQDRGIAGSVSCGRQP